ncbi:unnamed protein product [Effrenium voratum]|nr:unnamed protein product [Effrenium voratum]
MGVTGLLPDTRYTVEVHIAATEIVVARLEVRTAPASTCQFAGEDWGRSAEKLEKLEKRTRRRWHRQGHQGHQGLQGGLRPRRQAFGPSIIMPAIPPRSISDDDSTFAPSDDGADERHDFDFVAEDGSASLWRMCTWKRWPHQTPAPSNAICSPSWTASSWPGDKSRR